VPNTAYDAEKLAALLAAGNLTYEQIAEQVGISASMVGKVARGEYRRDIYERICEVLAERRRAMRTLGSHWAPEMMRVHIREGIDGKGETSRKCREYIMNAVRKDFSVLDMHYDPLMDSVVKEMLRDRGLDPDDDAAYDDLDTALDLACSGEDASAYNDGTVGEDRP